MKKIIFAAATALLLFSLAACGKGVSDTTTSSDTTTGAVTATAPETNAQDVTKSDADIKAEKFEELGNELLESDSINGISIGMTREEVVAKMGEPQESTDPIVWGSDGLEHFICYYDNISFEIEFSGESGNSRVNGITMRELSKYKTSRGIGIGSTADEVKEKYKGYINEEHSNETGIVCGSLYGGVVFGEENGKVVSIFIGAVAE